MSNFDVQIGRCADELREISRNLGRVNRCVEKFLDRTDARVPDTHVMARDVALPNPLPSSHPGLHCAWCMSDINFRETLEKYYTCDHGTLCAACAPCDECVPNEEN
jgi:hypothetical protein